MTPWRKIIGLLAILGVLLHAGLVVRHDVNVVASAWPDFFAEITNPIICSGGIIAPSSHHGGPQTPDAKRPGPSAPDNECPICEGICSAVMLPVPILKPVSIDARLLARLDARPARFDVRGSTSRPHARGPPNFVWIR